MAVVTVTQLFKERKSEFGVDGYRFVEYYQVHCNDVDDGPWTAIRDPGIPNYGDPHPQLSFATARLITAAPDQEQQCLFKVRVEYRSKDLADPGGEISDPLERPALINFGYRTHMEEYAEDVEGEKILDVSGTPFNPSLQREKSILALYVRWNVEGVDVARLTAYADAVNDDAFKVKAYKFPPLWVKMGDMKGYERVEAGQVYVDLSIQLLVQAPIKVKEETGGQRWDTQKSRLVSAWDHRLPNFGHNYLLKKDYADPEEAGETKAIWLPNVKPDGSIGMPPTTQPQAPVALDEYGRYEYPDPDDPTKIKRVEKAHISHFKPYPKLPFADWNWPQS